MAILSWNSEVKIGTLKARMQEFGWARLSSTNLKDLDSYFIQQVLAADLTRKTTYTWLPWSRPGINPTLQTGFPTFFFPNHRLISLIYNWRPQGQDYRLKRRGSVPIYLLMGNSNRMPRTSGLTLGSERRLYLETFNPAPGVYLPQWIQELERNTRKGNHWRAWGRIKKIESNWYTVLTGWTLSVNYTLALKSHPIYSSILDFIVAILAFPGSVLDIPCVHFFLPFLSNHCWLPTYMYQFLIFYCFSFYPLFTMFKLYCREYRCTEDAVEKKEYGTSPFLGINLGVEKTGIIRVGDSIQISG